MKRFCSTLLLAFCCFGGTILHAQAPQYSFTAGTSNNAIPFNSPSKAQWLFLPVNFGLTKPVVKIRNVYFRTVTTSPMVKQTDLTISLSSIASTSFPATTWITIGDTALYLPVSEAAVTNNGWLKYELQKPFVYDTISQGLVVDAHSSADEGPYNVAGGGGYNNRRLYATPDDLTPTRDANLPDFGFDIVPDIANNAGVQTLVMPASYCPGNQDIRVKIFNNGNNAISNVTVRWELNGNLQTAIPLNTLLNVFGGTGKSDTTILLGNVNIPTTGVNLRVWTSLPNGVTDPFTSDDTLTVLLRPSMTGSYSIGSAGDYTNFTDALADLHKLGSCGTTTFNVTAGTSFKELAPIAVNNLGNFGGPVIFQRAGVGTNPVIYGINGIGTSDAVITLNGTNNVTFDGIDVEDSSSNPTSTRQMEYGYRVRALNASKGATDNTIKNCKVRVLRSNSSSIGILQTTGTGGGITPIASSGAQKRNRFENVRIISGFKGIQLLGNASFPDSGCVITSTNDDTTIVGDSTANSVGTSSNTSAAIFGINLTNQRDAEVSGCIIKNVFHNGTMTGAETQGLSITNTGTATLGNVRIFNNRIHTLSRTTGTTATGAFVYAIKVDLSPTASAIVYNNIIYNLNATGPASANAGQVIRAIAHGPETGTGNASYYNNTVHISPSTATISSTCFYKAGTSTATMRNNIFSNAQAAQTGVAKHYAVNVVAGSIVSSNNLFSTVNTNGVLALVTSDKTTLPTYATAISSTLPSDGQERGSAYAVPNFTSAATGDFTFAGATPAAKSGTPVAGITTDIIGTTRNTTYPAIGAYETMQILLDSSAPVIGNVNITSGAVPIIRATINDNGNTTVAGDIQLWYRLGTSGPFTSFAPDSVPTGTMNGTYKWESTLAGLVVGNYQFYIAARDQVNPGLNIAFNPIQNISFTGVSPVDPVNYITNPHAGANVYVFIKTQVIGAGTYSIGSGGTYNNLTELATALNAAEVTGDLIYEVKGNYVSTSEVFPIIFNQFTNIGGPWKVTIRPELGATGIETSGYSSGTSLITLNGIKNIKFDGRPNGVGNVSEWTIRSKRSTPVSVPPFVFVNGSRQDTLTYLKLESGASANVLFSTSTTGTGNGSNVIAFCNITNRTDSLDIPAAGIQSDGTDGSLNDSNSVYGNNISNFSGNGVNVTGTGNGNSWNISGNHFFYSLAAATTAQTAIRLVPGTATARHMIAGNMIGGQAINAGGAKWANSGAIAWRGIVLTANNSGDSSLIYNNVISNVELTGTGTSASFIGIEVTTSKTSLHHNIVGDTVTLNSITFTGASGSHAGISLGSSITATYYNVIANLSCTAVGSTTANTTLRGIAASSNTGAEIIVRNNLIRNLSTTAWGNTATFNALVGIHTTPSNPNQRINDNVIFGLSCMGGNAVFSRCVGIQVGNNSGGGTISRNLVYDIKHTGTLPTAQATGIRILSGVNWTVDNNMVSIGSGTDSAIVTGIQDTSAATTLNVFYNTVYINGTNQSVTTGRSYAFSKDFTSAINVRNNIFDNARIGASFNYALRVVNTTVGLNSNYNVLNSANAANTGLWGSTAYDLANWKTTTLQDAASVQTPVNFASTTDLHLVSPSLGDPALTGTPVAVTTDFDGQARHSTYPYIGADESLSNPLPVKLLSFSARSMNTDVRLNWITASEIDASHFEIERSVDGKQFVSAGRVKAAGSTSQRQTYVFTDERAFATAGVDMLYYRLKSVDRNTHFEYSHIVTVGANEKAGSTVLRTYPNPFTTELFTELYSNTETDAIIRVSDITGKEVITEKQHLQTGDNTISIKSLDHLREGIYFISVEMNGEKHSGKIIKY
jgi:hypothetical protein